MILAIRNFLKRFSEEYEFAIFSIILIAVVVAINVIVFIVSAVLMVIFDNRTTIEQEPICSQFGLTKEIL